MKLFALIKANTMANGTGGKVYHAFSFDAREGIGPALCGTKPGRRGYWSSYLGEQITCPKCLKLIAKETK